MNSVIYYSRPAFPTLIQGRMAAHDEPTSSGRYRAMLRRRAPPTRSLILRVLAICDSGEECSCPLDFGSGQAGREPLFVLLNQRPRAIQNALTLAGQLERIHAAVFGAAGAANPAEPLEAACNRDEGRAVDTGGIRQGVLTQARIAAYQEQCAVLARCQPEPGQHVREHLKEARMSLLHSIADQLR